MTKCFLSVCFADLLILFVWGGVFCFNISWSVLITAQHTPRPYMEPTYMNLFTDTWLKKLKPTAQPQEFKEAPSPGFRVRITPGGKKSFVYSYSNPADGKMKRVMLGRYPAMTIKEARAKWSELSTLRMQGTTPKQQMKQEAAKRLQAAQQHVPQPGGTTVQQLINIYIDKWSAPHKKSWREDQRCLNKEFGAYYGDSPAHDITKQQIKLLVTNKRQKGKPAQAMQMVAIIRGMYNWAAEEPGYFEKPFITNPAIGIDNRGERKKYRYQPRDRFLNEQELCVALRLFPDEYRDVLTFVLLTGCRVTEALDMQWSEIHVGGEWRLPETRSKNGHAHTVYLSSQAQEILNRQQRINKWVWPRASTASGRINLSSVHYKLGTVDFGIEHFTIHDLRRTFSTWLAMQGFSRDVNDRILNHRTADIHTTYNRFRFDAPAKQAWQEWGNYIEGLRRAKAA